MRKNIGWVRKTCGVLLSLLTAWMIFSPTSQALRELPETYRLNVGDSYAFTVGTAVLSSTDERLRTLLLAVGLAKPEEQFLYKAEEMGADVLFAPSPNEMYPSRDMTWVEVTGDITKVLCGRTRPIHFRGVATVVSKLFNLAQPDKAYFGQKDAQQAQVLKRMVKDLFFPLEIRVMPIVREADGLAKSSRNVYLSKAERSAAVILSKALAKAKAAFEAGERDSAKLIALVTEMIQTEPLSNIDYVEMYQLPDLTPAEKTVTTDHLLAVAVKFGTTRLIDNVILQK